MRPDEMKERYEALETIIDKDESGKCSRFYKGAKAKMYVCKTHANHAMTKVTECYAQYVPVLYDMVNQLF